MGNNALLSVLGLMVFFGIINMTLNTRMGQSSQVVGAGIAYSSARDIAQSSVSLARLRVDTSNFPVAFSSSGSLNGGTYSVTASTAGDTIKLAVVGYYQNTSYPITVKLLRQMSYFPESAFRTSSRLRAKNLTYVDKYDSTTRMDGRNHDTSGTLTTSRANDVAGAMALESQDSATIYNLSTQQDSVLFGSPRIAVDSTISTPGGFADTLAAHADTVYQNAPGKSLTVSYRTWGSPTNPAIVFANASGSNYINFGNGFTGWGILVAKGYLWLGGTMRWNGLVLNYRGDTTWTVAGGNSKVIGSYVMVGSPGGRFELRKYGNILYSNSSLQIARSMLQKKLSGPQYGSYKIVGWYE